MLSIMLIADSAVAFSRPTGPRMYTVPGLCSIYTHQSVQMYQNAVLLLQVCPQR